MSEKSYSEYLNSEISLIQDQYKEFVAKTNEKSSLSKIIFDENSKLEKTTRQRGDVGLDWVYTIQHQIAFRWYIEFISDNPSLLSLDDDIFTCLDIGSKVEFVAMMASFTNYIQLDPNLNISSSESLKIIDANLAFNSGEAQNIPFDDKSFNWITSMHAIEHFGLGRYGDSIDPLGDIRGLKEISRVCNLGGWFLGSVPITTDEKERVVFNRNRIYSVKKIKSMLEDSGFSICHEHCVVAPLKDYGSNKTLGSIFSIKDYEDLMYRLPHPYEPDAVYIWLATKKLRRPTRT